MQLTASLDPKGYLQDEPKFGHGMLKYYAMSSEYINLNNGSYGTTPRPVQLAVNELTAEIESNPDLFHRVSYMPRLVNAREKVASLIGAETDEVVFVTNASMGVNTVLRNFDWEEGDLMFSFTTTYHSVTATTKYLSDKPPHPTAQVIHLTFPTTHKEILDHFKRHLKNNPAKPNKKRVAVIDSIVSNPGVSLPWKEMVAICKEEGVWSVIDAAHSIGQEVGINLTESSPDFWVSNCHKWLSAKRSVAILYVPFRNQHIIRASIPTSHSYKSPGSGGIDKSYFAKQFEWNGTIDWASTITVLDALEFRQWMGGEEKINAYCHDLAIKGGQLLAKTLGTRVLDPDGDLTLNMVNVELPLPGDVPGDLGAKIQESLQHKMLMEKKAFSAHFYHNGAWWTRCSAQVWNELVDFEKIGQKWIQACDEVKVELGLDNYVPAAARPSISSRGISTADK